MKHARGLTLIELLIALALFGVIGTLCWRATVQMIDGRAVVGAELERWRDIGRAVQRVETELTAALPGADTFARARGAAPEQPLAFVTLGLGQGGARSAFRVEAGYFDWLLWAEREGVSAPEVVPLLDGVSSLTWRFLHEGAWADEWPEAQAAAGLPDAVALELELSDVGTITRIFALR